MGHAYPATVPVPGDFNVLLWWSVFSPQMSRRLENHLIIWTNRLEPLGVLGAVQKEQLEYLDTTWYNWTIYPTIGYNWFLWQQLLIECATKKKQHLFQFRMPTTIFPPKMTSCLCTAAPLTTSQWWKTERFHVSLDILSYRMSSISQLQLLLQGTSKDCSSTYDSISTFPLKVWSQIICKKLNLWPSTCFNVLYFK